MRMNAVMSTVKWHVPEYTDERKVEIRETVA